jgi:carbonic anhydrase
LTDTRDLKTLLANNRDWAQEIESEDPGFFARAAMEHKPQYLWIGCSDSRVPADQLTRVKPGEMFVHRNVANVVNSTDLNCMAVVEFAVNTLGVRHIVICGHYGCAGVQAAMDNSVAGNIGTWLSDIRRLYLDHQHDLADLNDEEAHARVCELNVRAQVDKICNTGIVRHAWQNGSALTVHGCIFDISNGHLEQLGIRVDSVSDLERL